MLRVSANQRFLVHDDGSPFFYLGDTAWELFHRCTFAEIERYLNDRAAKRFTVIQAVLLAECDGLAVPNMQGHLPLIDADPTRPNEPYFAFVDQVVALAASLGLWIGMLPTWGDKWNRKWGQGPEIFTAENAYQYGFWLGQRYATAPLIWILGGDRPVENPAQRAIVEAMAAGLRAGDGGQHLITFHPHGGATSASSFHEAAWLDFNMWQSGHARNSPNYQGISGDYQRIPIKPCMDAEPGYEDHPAGFRLEQGYLDEYDVRKAAYWSLFAGAHGHTYGCHPIWQMWQPDRTPISVVRRPWYEALQLPGAGQMRHVRALIESRPFLSRIPDQGLIASDNGEGYQHSRATRDSAGSYAMIYIPDGRPIEIDTSRLSGERLIGHWFDPCLGICRRIAGPIIRGGVQRFVPPGGGPDWVLLLDDAQAGYPPP
ncbi:MAG: glycoside hydrolase family 140 protein [Roseiflexaceae bacterium]